MNDYDLKVDAFRREYLQTPGYCGNYKTPKDFSQLTTRQKRIWRSRYFKSIHVD